MSCDGGVLLVISIREPSGAAQTAGPGERGRNASVVDDGFPYLPRNYLNLSRMTMRF
jgi:hypothetical protein